MHTCEHILFPLLMYRIQKNSCSQENMDRVYHQAGVVLRDSIVETLLLWNTNDQYKNTDHDFMFVQFLMIGVFGGETLAKGDFEEAKMQFVRDVFDHRVGFDQERICQFNETVTKITDQFKRKIDRN